MKKEMTKTGMNLQDSFLNQVRKDNTEIKLTLLDSTSLIGYVRGFDNFTVILHAHGAQHLIYKHAIAQIIQKRPHPDFENELRQRASRETPEGQDVPAETPAEPRMEAKPENRPEPRNPQRDQRDQREQREQRPVQREPREQRESRRNNNTAETPTESASAEENHRREKFNTIDFSNLKVTDKK